MIVIAEAQAAIGRLRGDLVELPGQRADVIGAGEPLRRHVRDDHRVRADGPGAAERGFRLLSERAGVHAAHGQAGRVQVRAQAVRVRDHVEWLDRPVAEPGQAAKDPGPVGGQFLPHGVQLQRQQITHAYRPVFPVPSFQCRLSGAQAAPGRSASIPAAQ